MQITAPRPCWPHTWAWLNTALWKQISVGWEQQAWYALLHMPLAYLHGQLTRSLLSDGVLMGWEDGLLNTAQLLRFNYRARLPLSQHEHSGGGWGCRKKVGTRQLSGFLLPVPFPLKCVLALLCHSPAHLHNRQENNMCSLFCWLFLKGCQAMKTPREAAGNMYIQHLQESDPGGHTYSCGASTYSGTGFLLSPGELGGAAIFWGKSGLSCASLQAEAYDFCVQPPLMSQQRARRWHLLIVSGDSATRTELKLKLVCLLPIQAAV